MPRHVPAHKRYYEQSEPPSPVTCLVYLLGAAFILAGILLVLHFGGVI